MRRILVFVGLLACVATPAFAGSEYCDKKWGTHNSAENRICNSIYFGQNPRWWKPGQSTELPRARQRGGVKYYRAPKKNKK